MNRLFVTLIITCIIYNTSSNLYTNPYEEYYENTPFNVPSYRRYSDPYTNQNDFENRPKYINTDTVQKITETLGALNTVGKYLVNMTLDKSPKTRYSEEIPGALYTLSKNILGRNVTDTLAPFVREVIPAKATKRIENNVKEEQSNAQSCITPEGTPGVCNDLKDCPQLLLNLQSLRDSLCFKSLFVPGVCCPKLNSTKLKPVEPYKTTKRPVVIYTTTYRPVQRPSTTISTPRTTKFTTTFAPPAFEEDCGQPESANFRVVGGEESLPGRWPWMAAIFLKSQKTRTEFWCGGTLISSRHILTAAHCTKDSRQRSFTPKQFSVRLGDIDLVRTDEPSGPVTFQVSEIRAHSEFNRVGFYNDIAILVLDGRALKSEYIIPICLPPPRMKRDTFAGRSAVVIGWGTTYYGGKESSVQRQATIPVWRNEDCDESYYQPITSNFICAGFSRGGKDACQGDSGGPLLHLRDGRWYQIGVVSFGNKCGEPGYPGVYTRVTEYLTWIENNTKDA